MRCRCQTHLVHNTLPLLLNSFLLSLQSAIFIFEVLCAWARTLLIHYLLQLGIRRENLLFLFIQGSIWFHVFRNLFILHQPHNISIQSHIGLLIAWVLARFLSIVLCCILFSYRLGKVVYQMVLFSFDVFPDQKWERPKTAATTTHSEHLHDACDQQWQSNNEKQDYEHHDDWYIDYCGVYIFVFRVVSMPIIVMEAFKVVNYNS